MSKITAVIGVMLLMNVAMFVFTTSGVCVGDNCNIAEMNTEGDATMWSFFSNPIDQSSSTFWDKLFGSSLGILSLLTLAGGGIIAGLAILLKDVNVAYISVAIFISSACIGTWNRMWTLVNDSGFIFGGSSGGVVVMLIIGVGLATQLFYILDWGRGRV